MSSAIAMALLRLDQNRTSTNIMLAAASRPLRVSGSNRARLSSEGTNTCDKQKF